MFRFYGLEEAFYNKTFKLADVKLVEYMRFKVQRFKKNIHRTGCGLFNHSRLRNNKKGGTPG